jgi:hypothetical protein
MEAESYLSAGFGILTAIKAKPSGWTPFGLLAKVWTPGRLKGIQVGADVGTPFLAATQVFDVRPIPRKWLALERTADAASRFAHEGLILVTCSGAVGRPTVAYAAHAETLVSHDLLRVAPLNPRNTGWLYAYLHAPQVRAMATGAQYGHIIKHLEPAHLEAFPIPEIDDTHAADFRQRVDRIIALRNKGYRLTLEAESRLEAALGALKIKDRGERGFAVRAEPTIFAGRRRLDASVHVPAVAAIRRHLEKRGKGKVRLSDAGYDVWLPSRFRRIPAEDGIWMLDSADLTEVNPDRTKRIADGDFGDRYQGRVVAGWVLMARSGQTYGIIGTAILAGKELEGCVISDHVMRIKPAKDTKIRPGYLVTAMSHPTLGRPLVKSLAYGSSIPEIDVSDLAALEIVRLDPGIEADIAELAETSANARAEADILERAIAADAGAIIDRFLSSP